MTFSQLNYVMEVSRCGSINKAAAKLFVSQSNLSNSIQELEKELDIKIFLRSSKGIELTAEGSEFLSYIRPLIEQHKHIMTLYEQKTTKPCLRLSVATQRYPFAVKAFTDLFENAEYPKYELRIKETGIYQIIEDVYNNDCSIGVIFISRESEDFIRKTLESRDLVFTLLKSINPCIYLRKGHPLADKEIIHFNQLVNYPYVVFDHGQGKSLYYTEEVNLAGFKIPEKLIFVHDRASMYNIVTHSDAFSIGSGILSEGFCDNDIISVPVACNSDDVMKLGWIKHANKKLNEIEELYIKHLVENLEDE